MAVIMRIDVDEAYNSSQAATGYLNSFRFNYRFPGVRGLGYLKSLERLLTELNSRDITANVFFLRETIPQMGMRPLLRRHGVGAHVLFSEITNSRLVNEHVKALTRAMGKRASGLTLHCGGVLNGRDEWVWVYDEKACGVAAKKYGFKYFLGNYTDPSLRAKSYGGVMMFPSAFWANPEYRNVKRFTAKWLINESEKRDVVLLVHPSGLRRTGIRKIYERVTDACEFKALG